jgi:hypothetical protein
MSLRNPFKRLQDLIGAPPLLVGEVTDVDADLATIEMADGGVMTARGTASIGDIVYFRGGVIEGPAPTLSVVLIDV